MVMNVESLMRIETDNVSFHRSHSLPDRLVNGLAGSVKALAANLEASPFHHNKEVKMLLQRKVSNC